MYSSVARRCLHAGIAVAILHPASDALKIQHDMQPARASQQVNSTGSADATAALSSHAHASTYWSGKLAASLVQHPTADCYSQCDSKSGFCDWCGDGNACCRYGVNDAQECSRSKGFTNTEHHECVALEQEKPTLNWHMLERFILVPEHNLLFCYIEKVGCTAFNDIFAGLRKRYDARMIHTRKTTGWFQNSPYEHGFTKEDIESILVNSSWHKALFYRDPVERFVSAYRSKCEYADPDGKWVCGMTFGSPVASFPLAVHRLRELHDRNDPEHDYTMNVHFMKQSSFCGGLKNSLAYYDTIEPLVRDTAHQKVSKLLKDVGADPAWIDNFNQSFPPNTGDAFVQSDAHITNSFEHLQDYLPRKHPETLAALIHYYREDYRLFNISIPDWVYDYLRT